MEQIIAGAGKEEMALQGEEVSSAFFLYSTTGPHSNISLPTDVAMTDADPFLCVQPCPHTTGSDCSTKDPVKTTGPLTDSSQPN